MSGLANVSWWGEVLSTFPGMSLQWTKYASQFFGVGRTELFRCQKRIQVIRCVICSAWCCTEEGGVWSCFCWESLPYLERLWFLFKAILSANSRTLLVSQFSSSTWKGAISGKPFPSASQFSRGGKKPRNQQKKRIWLWQSLSSTAASGRIPGKKVVSAADCTCWEMDDGDLMFLLPHILSPSSFSNSDTSITLYVQVRVPQSFCIVTKGEDNGYEWCSRSQQGHNLRLLQ